MREKILISLPIVFIISILSWSTIANGVRANDLEKQLDKKDKEIAILENELINRNQELYTQRMISDDGWSLFYSCIGHEPYEGYPFE